MYMNNLYHITKLVVLIGPVKMIVEGKTSEISVIYGPIKKVSLI